MGISTKLDHIHQDVKSNRWMRYFTTFNRLALAAGFIPAGYVKIIGERFTDLHNNQPMGHFLEALHQTGYYYTLIGIAQMLAGLLLLIPRTALIGVLIYFPIILNICLLSFSVRFEGSLLTAPLMVISCVYLLCWDYDKLKLILPFNQHLIPKPKVITNKFPLAFFSMVFLIILAVGFTVTHLYTIMPRNTIKDCNARTKRSEHPDALLKFCDCVHNKGIPLAKCVDDYNKEKAKR
ncbi:MAG: DoxX family protein [Pedobacter sp.]|nr:MAG: DoxX family protein [Pedobacter sp.]